MKIHKLKINPYWLPSILNGEKTNEVRFNDRDYQTGDLLEFEGCEFKFTITHVLRECDFPIGLKDNHSILSIKLHNS